jgi:ATP-dependent Lhr-like helicase
VTAFDRLSPALAYQIVNELGFRSLRPVQDLAIEAVLDGKNCVVLAPTAGGKTEAAFFPILSRMDREDWKPVSVLYLSPIRALLNNQEIRIERYAGLIGRHVMKWHGDVEGGPRKRFLANPADILLTTPESLEAMMMSPRVPTRELFSGLQAVIIDEVHAFAADDRGAHLSAVLERLVSFAGRDVQRIGLSATVGNPDEILRWLAGSSKRDGALVDPKGAKKQASLALDFVGSMSGAATVIRLLHPGRKRLVFVDSRRKAEELAKLLRDQAVDTFLSHGSLSAPERRDAERAFAEGNDCVIVATSALELGIDVGDLDHVLQIDAPSSVASFLQRMGRTGRRDDTAPNCTFLATKDTAVLQVAGIIELHRNGWVEPVQPHSAASHVFAHQVMALGIERSGVPRPDVEALLHGAAAFRGLTVESRNAIIEHMLARGVLSDHDGRLWLGEEGERRYGRANFRELYAVFDAPRTITVLWNAHEIGVVDASFLLALGEAQGVGACFTLGGRAWKVHHIDWKRAVCAVVPSEDGRAARWSGGARFLGYELCQAMRRVLVREELDAACSRRAREVLGSLQAEHAFLRDDPSPIVDSPGEIVWWNFAGGAANVLLSKMLAKEVGERVIVRNTGLRFTGDAARSAQAIREALRRYRDEGRPNEADITEASTPLRGGSISKFEPCVPEALFAPLVARRIIDAGGAKAALDTFSVR